VKVCLKTLEENPDIKGTFFGELMKQQLMCATSVFFLFFSPLLLLGKECEHGVFV